MDLIDIGATVSSVCGFESFSVHLLWSLFEKE